MRRGKGRGYPPCIPPYPAKRGGGVGWGEDNLQNRKGTNFFVSL